MVVTTMVMVEAVVAVLTTVVACIRIRTAQAQRHALSIIIASPPLQTSLEERRGANDNLWAARRYETQT
jgi:hypothetical protein